MYRDYYLSFKDEEEAKSVLYRIEGAVEASEGVEAVEGYEVANYRNIDTIGVIYKPTGEVDDEGNPLLSPIEGWHVNVRLLDDEDAAPLESYVVTPSTPLRVWG